jgi:hypothetical protein
MFSALSVHGSGAAKLLYLSWTLQWQLRLLLLQNMLLVPCLVMLPKEQPASAASWLQLEMIDAVAMSSQRLRHSEIERFAVLWRANGVRLFALRASSRAQQLGFQGIDWSLLVNMHDVVGFAGLCTDQQRSKDLFMRLLMLR